MIYLEHSPSGPLSRYVQILWYCENYQVSHRRERVLPNGAVQIILCLSHDKLPHWPNHAPDAAPEQLSHSLVTGVHTEYVIINTSSLECIVGAQFWPGAAPFILGVPADVVSHQEVDLSDVWGTGVETLRDQLKSVPSGQERLRVLERHLATRICPEPESNRAVRFAIEKFQHVPHLESIAEVSRTVGLSSRRFAQVFREQVGVTPKVYCRLRRFHAALQAIHQGRDVDWAQLALSTGYYDQSHFVNEFRAFSGVNPNAYLTGRSQWTNHVVLD